MPLSWYDQYIFNGYHGYVAANHWRSLNDRFWGVSRRPLKTVVCLLMAVSWPSRSIKINVSYREIPVSAPDPQETLKPDFRIAAYPWEAASRFLRTNWLHRLKVVIAPQTPNSKIWDGYRQERLLQRYRGRPDLVPIFIIDVFSKYLLRSQITFLALIPCQFPENRRFRHAQQRRYLFLVLLCFL